MLATSTFLDVAAVEAWDTWFRWRDGGVLKDLSLETTWRRVATYLADAQSTPAGHWFLQSLLTAFSRWRLLIDERILATAGTGFVGWPSDGLVAVLNAAAFVSARHSGVARFDLAAFADTAELAVKALDLAAGCSGTRRPPSSVMRVGIIGLADAFALLELPYDSKPARDLAIEIGRTLTRGTSLGAIRAVQARPAVKTGERVTESTVAAVDVRDVGRPYASLTAITSQPRLASFANNVADSIYPRRSHPCIKPACPSEGEEAWWAMRRALQPWVDEPIPAPPCHALPTGDRSPGYPD
jgi:ribonucleoside-diphosphate reductase alpha chain